MELERRVHAILEENELLQNTVDDLQEKTMLLERQWNEKDLQVRIQKDLPSTEKQMCWSQTLIRNKAIY